MILLNRDQIGVAQCLPLGNANTWVEVIQVESNGVSMRAHEHALVRSVAGTEIVYSLDDSALAFGTRLAAGKGKGEVFPDAPEDLLVIVEPSVR